MSGLLQVLLLSMLFTELVGCASVPETPDHFAEEYHFSDLRISRVALVTYLSPPEIESVDVGFTRGQGAARGAARGAAGGAVLGASAGISLLPAAFACGPLAWVCVPGTIAVTGALALGGAIVGTAAGAVAGTGEGQPADMLAEAEANSTSMLTSAYLQESLLEAAKRYGQDNTDLDFIRVPSADRDGQPSKTDYKALSSESIDVVQEIALLSVKLEDRLEVQAEARLISVQTGMLLRKDHYSFVSGKHTPKTWMVDDASPLKGAIERGLVTIAEDVIDQSFPSYLANRPRLRGAHYNVECPANMAEHAKWFCSQADSGIADAQRRIGDLFYCGSAKNARAGTITDMDLVGAYVWYSLASSGNNKMAQARLRITQNELPSDQLNEAQQRLNVWKPRQGQCMMDLVEAGLIK